jgi:predicted porin
MFMNKKQATPLALATLLACAPTWAQSSVTIYGAVDVAVGKTYQVDSTQVKPGRVGLQSSSMVNLQDSFVGFRGVEDLGGGLQAGFQLEQGLDASSGATDPAGAFARNSSVWVGDSWGRIKLGRATTPSYDAMASWDLMGAGNNSIAVRVFGAVGAGLRQSNQISYRTPQLGGLMLEAAYVPKDNDLLNGANRSKVDLGATYRTGPLTMGAAYNKASDQKANFAFGAKYQYQNLELSGGYFQSRNGRYYDPSTLLSVANAIFSSSGITLGAKATWNQFSAGIEIARETKAEYTLGNAQYRRKKYTNATINGTYALSKRTQTYINYMREGTLNNYSIGVNHSF